ncbi:MerC domain-containing protein [Mucilaginibacter robiniae]|uniref:MerC domain-containing protein n=1 Tax=Mucilaginibacter robiniae TaxID=2728022 RepID=A0A7L5E7G7_9SPHI|nr:MerC domain-containing protein [Mucilaginibacter robiniae]
MYRRLDHIGISLSLLCAIHCAMLPLILTVLPLLGLGFLASEYWEIGIIGSSLIVGCTSLISSYIKNRVVMPLLILVAGFTIITIGKLCITEAYEWMFMTAGGLLVATAHFYNWRLIHKEVESSTCCASNQCPNA